MNTAGRMKLSVAFTAMALHLIALGSASMPPPLAREDNWSDVPSREDTHEQVDVLGLGAPGQYPALEELLMSNPIQEAPPTPTAEPEHPVETAAEAVNHVAQQAEQTRQQRNLADLLGTLSRLDKATHRAQRPTAPAHPRYGGFDVFDGRGSWPSFPSHLLPSWDWDQGLDSLNRQFDNMWLDGFMQRHQLDKLFEDAFSDPFFSKPSRLPHARRHSTPQLSDKRPQEQVQTAPPQRGVQKREDMGVTSPSRRTTVTEWRPHVDVVEHSDKFVVHADLPGVKQDDIKISVKDGVMTLSGSRSETKHFDESDSHEGINHRPQYVRTERFSGSFSRSFRVPKELDVASIKATYHEGVLDVELPKPSPNNSDAHQVPIHPKY